MSKEEIIYALCVENRAGTNGANLDHFRPRPKDGDLAAWLGMGEKRRPANGTRAPVVERETAGRQGKGEDGKAKTSEAKLGCVFNEEEYDRNAAIKRLFHWPGERMYYAVSERREAGLEMP